MVSGTFSIPLEAYSSLTDGRTLKVRCAGKCCASTLGVTRIGWSNWRPSRCLSRRRVSRRHTTIRWYYSGPRVPVNRSWLWGSPSVGAAHPDHQVIVVNGNDFARSYANAVDTDSLATFRRKARAADLFVLDDVQLLGPKPAAQGELVRTIDALQEQDNSILITINQVPALDDALTPMLQSRLSAGLTVPLTAPGPAARKLLLQRLAQLHEVQISESAIELLANSSVGQSSAPMTVPQLNHAVLQLGQDPAGSTAAVVDVEAVRQFLYEQLQHQQPTLRSISTMVAQHFSLRTQELRGPSRRRHVVRARGIAMSLAWKLTGKSLDAVGRYFGNRDHTTVLHACRRTENLQQTDPAVGKAMEELAARLSVR